MRRHEHRGFVWFTTDYYEPGDDVATNADGVRIVAEPGEDVCDLIDAWWEARWEALEAEGPERLASLDETLRELETAL